MRVSRIARVHKRATFAKASQLWLLLLPMPSEIASTTARPCLVAGEQCTYHCEAAARCALLYALLRFALQKHFIDESVCIACCCHGSRVLCTCLVFRVYGEAYMLVNACVFSLAPSAAFTAAPWTLMRPSALGRGAWACVEWARDTARRPLRQSLRVGRRSICIKQSVSDARPVRV